MGDGIGPEVTQQSLKILDAVGQQFGHKFYFTYCLMGAEAINKTGNSLPAETLETCLDSDAVLFGAVGDPKYDNDPNAKVRPAEGLSSLKKSLDLFANIRPITTYKALHHLSPLKNKHLENVDFVIFRELGGGTYPGKKETNEEQTYATDECAYSREEIERISHMAFRQAQARKKKLTLVDKANVLETSRLWRMVVQQLEKKYSDVKVDYMLVDNAAMQIVLNPSQFDVVLTENMFGNIISDEASALCGSTGLVPSASIGSTVAMFEPIHGSYPQAAGKDIANPLGSVLSAAMMLEYFRMYKEAALVRKAVEWTITNGFVSRDIDAVNNYSTSTIGDLIRDFIENRLPLNIDKNDMLLSKSTII